MKANRAMVAAAIAALAWTGTAVAQGPMGRGPGGPGAGLEAILDLTDAQRAQLRALHESRRESMRPVMEQAHATREAFEQALSEESPDPTAIGEAALAMKAARDKAQAAQEALRKDVEKILTEEQRAQLAQSGRGPGGRGFGPRHGGPLGPPPAEQ